MYDASATASSAESAEGGGGCGRRVMKWVALCGVVHVPRCTSEAV